MEYAAVIPQLVTQAHWAFLVSQTKRSASCGTHVPHSQGGSTPKTKELLIIVLSPLSLSIRREEKARFAPSPPFPSPTATPCHQPARRVDREGAGPPFIPGVGVGSLGRIRGLGLDHSRYWTSEVPSTSLYVVKAVG